MKTKNRIQEIKEIIKDYMEEHNYTSAPTQYEMLEVLDMYNISGKEFMKAIDEIGEELEEQGYKLVWNWCEDYDANCQRFVLIDDNEEEEVE